MLKAECKAEGCGFTVRVAASRVKELGPPHCPKHGAMAVDLPPDFIFEDFARKIYCEKPHPTPRFLFPALYGGALDQRREPVQEYKIMFVLDAPSRQFTKAGWRQCNIPATHNAAIQCHRQIFLNWAYDDNQNSTLVRHLFTSLCGERPTTDSDFYERFYITDAWKDAVHDKAAYNRMTRVAQQQYDEYWLCKLRIELQHVYTRRIIFVGQEAARAGWRAGWRLIKKRGVPTHEIPFPGGRSIASKRERQLQFIEIVNNLATLISRACSISDSDAV
jgi:hypothetical protein